MTKTVKAKKKVETSDEGTKQIVGGAALLFASFLIYIFYEDIGTLLCRGAGQGSCSFGDGMLTTILLGLVITGATIAGIIILGVGIFRMIRTS